MKKKGFTLIELLVVIAIIAILAAILLPAINNARAMGRRTACINNFKQFATALQMFADDHYNRFPANSGEMYGVSGDKDIYPDYINKAEIFRCPSDISAKIPTTINTDTKDADNSCHISYAFVYGLTVANSATTSVPIACDNSRLVGSAYSANHNGGTNVLYLDGSVLWVPYRGEAANGGYWSSDLTTDTEGGMGKIACRSDGDSITLTSSADPKWGE